jgi:acetyl esterase/lipase
MMTSRLALGDVGSLEVFRSQDVNYAQRIWADGGEAELHVWANAFHGFDLAHPDATVSRFAIAAQRSWPSRFPTDRI